jgi:hypothetical protein
MMSQSDSAKTVLLVEDQPATVRILRERLARLPGLTVRLVRSLNRALDQIEEKRPDLVILDLYLPDDWDRLLPYRDRVALNEFNQGELLGALLEERGILYFHYTSHLPFYRSRRTETVLTKAQPVDDVVAKVRGLLGI